MTAVPTTASGRVSAASAMHGTPCLKCVWAASRGGKVLRSGFAGAVDSAVKTLAEIALDEIPRISTGTGELDLVLGGGLVPGSCVLVGGEPGAGKSTLLLQTLCKLAENHTALYVTGEESPQQVAMRAHRLDLPTDKLEIMAETSVETVCRYCRAEAPQNSRGRLYSSDAYGRGVLSAGQCLSGARECVYASALCQADRHSINSGGPCDQRWIAGGPQSIGAYD